MPLLERRQSLFVAAAALAGLAAGLLLPIGPAAEHLVLPALLVMLAAVFVQMNASHVGEVRNAKALVVASLVLNFVFGPWVPGCSGTHPTCALVFCCCW